MDVLKCNPWSTFFNKLCEWLEEEAELYTLVELHERMIDFAGGSNDVYWSKIFEISIKILYFSQKIKLGRMLCACATCLTSLLTTNGTKRKNETYRMNLKELLLVQRKLAKLKSGKWPLKQTFGTQMLDLNAHLHCWRISWKKLWNQKFNKHLSDSTSCALLDHVQWFLH